MPTDIEIYYASLSQLYEPPPASIKSPVPPRQCKPLDRQIEELMRCLPPQLLNRPWSMAELVQRLQGKYRDRPHGQQVGEALLRSGWSKERLWGKGWDGRRVWLAPRNP